MHVETYSREAFIAWNSPALHRSDKLLSDALDHYFEDKKWHFKQTSKEGQASVLRLGFKSKVLHRMGNEKSKLTFME